jgi:imidazolonepropionase-like amidohydrolase
VIDHGAVLIADTAIEAVGRSADVGQPGDAEVVVLGDSTLLPGLIDVHNHVTFSGDAHVVQQVVARDVDGMLAQGRVTAANLLAAGITTVRDLGALGNAAFRLAREIDAGQTIGPHIVPSTAQLTSAGGPNSPLGGGCADLPAARDRIDADAAQGARVVKIIATGSITDTASDPTRPVFDDAMVNGIVEHAHGRGMQVAAHAHGTAGIAQAARCGVDTIEHASFLTHVETVDTGVDAATPGSTQPGLATWPDADTLSVLAEHRPWIVPTIATAFAHSQVDRATPASLRDLAHRLAIARMLLEHGLSLVTGTDGGGPGCPNLSLVVEIEQFRQLGMTAMDAIVAATGQAAACLGLPDRGVLRADSRADVIAVPGNPLEHLDTLRSPILVIIDGRTAHRVQQRPQP